MPPAQPTDWKTEPLPASAQPLVFSAVFSPEEFAQMALGLIPQAMEDKWFIYYTAPWLYLHRSWTGYCIYKVRFAPAANGMAVAEVWVNRDPNQYTETNAAADVRQLAVLLGARAGRDVRAAMQQALRKAANT